MMRNDYGHDYYKGRHQKTVYSARTILSIILDALPEVHSAIDFGCGVGTWLSVLKERGVREIKGVDGPWVDQDLLEIPRQDFRQVNFEEIISCDKKYDLAITLELAEHLSEKTAIRFVESLVTASDFILFSAAIPFQGGKGHINEQWPEYWADIFNERGYVALDFVRRKIWNDKQISIWYRQNIQVFVRKEQMQRFKVPGLDECDNNFPISLVHPDIYLFKVNQMQSVKGSWDLFRRAVKNWIKKKISKRG